MGVRGLQRCGGQAAPRPSWPTASGRPPTAIRRGPTARGATDIAIGNGGFPFGLSFGRQYSSHRRHKDGPLGLGWTHNYDISAKVVSDSFLALGTESAINAAGPYRQPLRDPGYPGVGDDSNRTIANLCETWLMDQTKDNVVEIKQGSGLMRFTKKVRRHLQPAAGPGPQAHARSAATGGSRTARASSTTSTAAASSASGATPTATSWSFTYSSGKLTGVAAKIGGTTTSRTLSFTYTGDHITSVSDSASRSISYFYTGNGELWKYRNPDYVQGSMSGVEV